MKKSDSPKKPAKPRAASDQLEQSIQKRAPKGGSTQIGSGSGGHAQAGGRNSSMSKRQSS